MPKGQKGNRTRWMARPVWLMANKMCGGQLLTIIRYERARGQSYDAIVRFLHSTYGVELSKNTMARWCKEIAAMDERGELL